MRCCGEPERTSRSHFINARTGSLNLADLVRLFEAVDRRRIHRNELMGHESLEIQIRDRAGHGLPVHLLGIVELMPARIAARMEMPDESNVLPNRSDQIAFHDL